MSVLLVVLALSGCVVVRGAPSSAAVTGSSSTEPASSPQIGASATSNNASFSAGSAVGAGSFPRSFLIPRTDTSIRIGGS